MAVITSNAGLLLSFAIAMFFAIMQMFFPIWFVQQYNLSLTAMEQNEKWAITSMVIFTGVCYFIGASFNSVTFRNGSDDSKATLCLMNAVQSVPAIILILVSVSHWTDLGVSAPGIYFGAVLWAICGVVNLLGANFPPAFKMAPIGKPLYWGFILAIVVFSLYAIVMLFATDFIIESYGTEFQGVPKKVMQGMLKYGVAPYFIYIVLLCTAQLVTVGIHNTYVIARGLCMIYFGLVMMCAMSAAIWGTLNKDGDYDKLIKGQYFNIVLWLIFFALSYLPLVRIDPTLKDTVEKEVEAAPAKKTKKAKASAAEAAEPAPAPQPVMQPLIAPVLPLATSSTLVPSYSMVAAPQFQGQAYTYAQPVAYAQAPSSFPVTTAYSPSTTAYAAPATYPTGFATTSYTGGAVV
jgi:hypothetical protein